MFCNVERVTSYSNMRKILNFFKICYEIERLEHMDGPNIREERLGHLRVTYLEQ